MNKIINFLSLKNILLIIASILAMFMIIILVIHYFMGTLAWDIFFISLVIITIPFLTADVIADRAPKLSIVLFMIDIHHNNIKEAEEQEKQLKEQT
jgi:hypothetical protein